MHLILLALLAAASLQASPQAANPLAAIFVYNGGWTITSPHTMVGPGKTDSLVDRCQSTGNFYACEQVVNGKTLALILFVAADKPGHFYTQPILPDGHAVGRGDLVIAHEAAGDHWTFSSKDVEADKTTWYRTENYFTGTAKIHFEQFESNDGVKWEQKNSGDEVHSTN